VVVLIVMGVVVVALGAVLLLGGRDGVASPLAEALAIDMGPASLAMLTAVGVAMVGLGAYPLVVPWNRPAVTAVGSTPGAPPAVQVARLDVPAATTAPVRSGGG
jgi:hypothetical protein